MPEGSAKGSKWLGSWNQDVHSLLQTHLGTSCELLGMDLSAKRACPEVTLCHVHTPMLCKRRGNIGNTPPWQLSLQQEGLSSHLAPDKNVLISSCQRGWCALCSHSFSHSLIKSLWPLSLPRHSSSLEKSWHCSSFFAQQGGWELLLSSASLHLSLSTADVQCCCIEAQIWIADRVSLLGSQSQVFWVTQQFPHPCRESNGDQFCGEKMLF